MRSIRGIEWSVPEGDLTSHVYSSGAYFGRLRSTRGNFYFGNKVPRDGILLRQKEAEIA